MSKKYSAFLLIWVSIIKYFVTKSNVQTHYNVKLWMEFTVCKFCIKVIMESYSCFHGSILLLLHLPLPPLCTTSAVVCLCMLDESVASYGTASSTFNLKPFQSVMCLLWNIYKKIISWLLATSPWGQPWNCSNHAKLPVKEVYPIGFAPPRFTVDVKCVIRMVESSDLSCPLRCQCNTTSALQVGYFFFWNADDTIVTL